MAIPENSTDNANNGDNASIGATPSSIVLDHNHPLYLHASNGPGSMSVGLILTGMENYSLWSRAMKEDFGPNLGSQWDWCNAIVTSWLMSNVSRDLVTGVQFSSNAQKGISSVSIYFTKLKDLWAEYDSILPPPTSATEYIEQLEYQRLLQFLMGLNDNFEQARSQILLMSSLPSIDKAYAMVVQEESRKSFTGSTYGQTRHNDPTALFTAQSISRPRRNYSLECDFCHLKGHTRNECYKLIKCEFCNKTGHLKENCYKIIGYPSDFKQKNKANAVMIDGAEQ
ncbi:uncharacterized protein LOC142166113 [Nicotiana tabacum]|uniref:Uncharacterized protein LOC142166113 n=1 Tax=Nicotiana tabacum TaxID=4097 RepID=A0AC58S6K8_TOBAC